jgi:hypothetical protein
MKSQIPRERVLNSVVLFAAWLVVIAACIPDDGESPTRAVPIAYRAL